jgi:hypothetical protein
LQEFQFTVQGRSQEHYSSNLFRPESAPGWLVKTDLETVEKTRHLSYAKSEDISKSEGEEAGKENLEERFWWLQGRFSVHKVDVVESIIMKHLPAAPFETSPKPRDIRR